jgi:hypothetical protein
MHPLQTMNFADREMFAYNSQRTKQKAELDRILSHPEQRIKHCFGFLPHYINGQDELMAIKCYDGIAKYSDQLDYSESHF